MNKSQPNSEWDLMSFPCNSKLNFILWSQAILMSFDSFKSFANILTVKNEPRFSIWAMTFRAITHCVSSFSFRRALFSAVYFWGWFACRSLYESIKASAARAWLEKRKNGTHVAQWGQNLINATEAKLSEQPKPITGQKNHRRKHE